MEKKMTAKLEGTKVEAKAAETKPVAKAAETEAAGKENSAEVNRETVEKKPDTKTEKKTEKVAGKRTYKKAKKVEKEALKPDVYLQYQDREAVIEETIEAVKARFVAEGHRVSTIKSLQLYLKPEEGAAYYVINQKFAGRVDLF